MADDRRQAINSSVLSSATHPPLLESSFFDFCFVSFIEKRKSCHNCNAIKAVAAAAVAVALAWFSPLYLLPTAADRALEAPIPPPMITEKATKKVVSNLDYIYKPTQSDSQSDRQRSSKSLTSAPQLIISFAGLLVISILWQKERGHFTAKLQIFLFFVVNFCFSTYCFCFIYQSWSIAR